MEILPVIISLSLSISSNTFTKNLYVYEEIMEQNAEPMLNIQYHLKIVLASIRRSLAIVV